MILSDTHYLSKSIRGLNSHQANPRLQKIYRQYYTTKERDFIDLIFFISDHGLEKVEEANLTQVSYDQFLWDLLQKECDRRRENAKQDRVRRAAFPYKKYLENIIAEDLPEDAQRKFKTLS